MEGIRPYLVILLLFFINKTQADIVVDTTLGKVAGIEVKSVLKDEKYYSFMGIPYAKPPLGKHRFLVSPFLLILIK